jgi:hypothetical protein
MFGPWPCWGGGVAVPCAWPWSSLCVGEDTILPQLCPMLACNRPGSRAVPYAPSFPGGNGGWCAVISARSRRSNATSGSVWSVLFWPKSVVVSESDIGWPSEDGPAVVLSLDESCPKRGPSATLRGGVLFCDGVALGLGPNPSRVCERVDTLLTRVPALSAFASAILWWQSPDLWC